MSRTDLSLERARPADVAGLSRVGAETFTEKFGHLYTPENLQAFLDEYHSPQWYAEALACNDTAIWVARGQRDELIAYAIAGANSLPVDEESTRAGEVKRIYVRDAYQGQGIGRRLLTIMMAWLKARLRTPLYVGVYSENFGAQNLYYRLGFEKVAEYLFPVGTHDDLEFILMRTETPDDIAVRQYKDTYGAECLDVIARAFGQKDEAELVSRLRDDGDILHEVVARQGNKITGHASISRLIITTATGVIEAAALAPISVLPEAQRQGTGFLLCEALLHWWQSYGTGVCVVLGHPAYYPRLGFSAGGARKHFVCPFPDAGDAFMLSDPKGILAGVTGASLRYAAAFNIR